MAVQRLELTCAWCGATFIGDKRHRYCSEECAHEAALKRIREWSRRRHETKHEQECERRRNYYRRNKEAEKARSQAWIEKHPERRREHQKKYYEAHKEATA